MRLCGGNREETAGSIKRYTDEGEGLRLTGERAHEREPPLVCFFMLAEMMESISANRFKAVEILNGYPFFGFIGRWSLSGKWA